MRKFLFAFLLLLCASVAYAGTWGGLFGGSSGNAPLTNLSVSSKISTTAPLGTVLSLQGNPFVTSLTRWTDSGSNWTFDSGNGGQALHATGATDTLTSGTAVVSGQSYFLTYSVAFTSGTGVTASAGGATDTQRASSATFTKYFTASATTALVFTPSSNFVGSVYAVSLWPVGPAVTSCGTGPTVQQGSSNVAGYVAVGSGSPTACTVAFATAFTNTPACSFEAIGATVVSTSLSALSNSGFTVNLGATDTGFTYHCIGLNE
jgi:hypothetical protein